MELDQEPHATKGFSSFFRPSNPLTVRILDASVRQARRSSIPERRKLSNTLLCVSRSAIKDQSTIARVREDISRRLWRYLGTLGRRNANQNEFTLIRSKEIAVGMEERLGLTEDDRELTYNLAREFQVWLVEGCHGIFRTYWGKIHAYTYEGENVIEVWMRPIESHEKETHEPAQVVTNYYQGELDEEDLIRKLVETKDRG